MKEIHINKERKVVFKTVYTFFVFFVLFLFLITGSFAFESLSSFQEYDARFSSLSLIGVIISKDSSSSMAVLADKRSGETVMLRVGERIFDLELTHVFENRIVLRKDDRTYQIFLGRGNIASVREKPKKKPRQIQTSPRVVKPPIKEPLETEQQDKNIIKKEFKREEILRRIEAEMQMIMKEARFVPNLVDGEMSGIRITGLPRRSIISEVGINVNDIIKEVNGVELNDMDTLFSLYNRFRNDDQFEVTIERKGKSYHYLYILK